MSNDIIFKEMARRKLRFHKKEKWDEISLWGLFRWGSVSRLIKDGILLTNYVKENKVIWVTPTKETWENKIKPLTEQYTLKELTRMVWGC